MRTIETTITVLPDGSIHIPSHADLLPGEHRAVIEVEELTQPVRVPKSPLKLQVLDIGTWPDGFNVRREEIYDDWGR